MKTKNLQVAGSPGTTITMVHRQTGLNIGVVNVAEDGDVPFHSHRCAVTMFVIEGEAQVRIANGLGRLVKKGDVVRTGPNEGHGFKVKRGPFAFVSIADDDGIVLPNGALDMDYNQ